jgi:hypothetical protein
MIVDEIQGIDLGTDNVTEMGWLAERHGFRPALIHYSCKPLQGVSVAKAA